MPTTDPGARVYADDRRAAPADPDPDVRLTLVHVARALGVERRHLKALARDADATARSAAELALWRA